MKFTIIGVFCALLLMSCATDDVAAYEVGSDFIENDIQIRVIDSFTVNTGTFQIDSIMTSGSSRILLGNISDEYLGDTKAQSYFQVVNTNFSIDSDAVYDSIGFVLNYDTYSYGDTLVPQTYTIHEVLETVEPEDGDDFYNTDFLEFDSESRGVLTFTPKPNTDPLYIPMDDDLGEEIFNKILDNDINNSDDFSQYFKGLTIVPDTSVDSHILGFDIYSSMRLYYTVKVDDIEDESDYIEFSISDIDKQFNAISTDLSTGVIGEIDDSETVTYSEDVDDNVYVFQASSGVFSKIEIPAIKKLRELSNTATTLSAELTFKPLKGTYDDLHPLPTFLSVFIVDHKNRFLGQLTNTSGATVFAYLNSSDDEFDENTFYSVDLSAYVETILANDEDLNYSLAIQFTDGNKAVDRMVLSDAQSESTKLTVKYLNY